jgi:hypothetical protein
MLSQATRQQKLSALQTVTQQSSSEHAGPCSSKHEPDDGSPQPAHSTNA